MLCYSLLLTQHKNTSHTKPALKPVHAHALVTHTHTTMHALLHPISTPQGHTFERASIVEWLGVRGTCPITREPLSVADLAPNRALRCACVLRCRFAHQVFNTHPYDCVICRPVSRLRLAEASGVCIGTFLYPKRECRHWRHRSVSVPLA